MDMQVHTKTYSVKADDQNKKIDITISQPFSGTILGLSTWSSALFLADCLHFLGDTTLDSDNTAVKTNGVSHTNGSAKPETPARQRVLEIGAGTGLAGIASALLWDADVVLTDIAACTENLAKTISLNADALAQASSTLKAGALDWSEPEQLALQYDKPRTPETLGQYDVILAADTVYDEVHPEMIGKVVDLWLKRDRNAKVIMGYPLRVMHLDFIRDLWQRLERIGLRAVREGKVDVGEEWDDERLCEWAVWMWDDSTRASSVEES